MHWRNRLFLTLEFLTFNLFFLKVYYYVVYKQKSMEWHHWSGSIALRDISKKASKQVSRRLVLFCKFDPLLEIRYWRLNCTCQWLCPQWFGFGIAKLSRRPSTLKLVCYLPLYAHSLREVENMRLPKCLGAQRSECCQQWTGQQRIAQL